jgi:hypothetical protein
MVRGIVCENEENPVRIKATRSHFILVIILIRLKKKNGLKLLI